MHPVVILPDNPNLDPDDLQVLLGPRRQMPHYRAALRVCDVREAALAAGEGHRVLLPRPPAKAGAAVVLRRLRAAAGIPQPLAAGTDEGLTAGTIAAGWNCGRGESK